MINIYIIEDEQNTREQLTKYVRLITQAYLPVNVRSFECAEEFLQQNMLEETQIILCDVEMPGMNGIELGQFVKKHNPDVYLVYLTSYPQYAVDSYTVDAEQYILKHTVKERLESILSQLIKKIRNERGQYIIIETNHIFNKIYYNQILYVAKDKSTKYLIIKTNVQEIKKRSSLDDFLRLVNPKQFVIIDRGIVVNVDCIVKMDKSKVYLDNGEEISISRRRYGEVKKTLNRYFSVCIE